jgi:hypothetical protein
LILIKYASIATSLLDSLERQNTDGEKLPLFTSFTSNSIKYQKYTKPSSIIFPKRSFGWSNYKIQYVNQFIETTDFLYSNLILKETKLLNIVSCYCVTEDLVVKDYKITLYNTLKTFHLQYRAKSLSNKLTKHLPLVASTIYKRRFLNVFLTERHLLYHYGSNCCLEL